MIFCFMPLLIWVVIGSVNHKVSCACFWSVVTNILFCVCNMSKRNPKPIYKAWFSSACRNKQFNYWREQKGRVKLVRRQPVIEVMWLDKTIQCSIVIALMNKRNCQTNSLHYSLDSFFFDLAILSFFSECREETFKERREGIQTNLYVGFCRGMCQRMRRV